MYLHYDIKHDLFKYNKMNSKNSFRYSLMVEQEHIDALQHVNNVVYLKWVNDISEKHWSFLSIGDLNKKYFWICIRHEIDYIGQAVTGDELTILTWIGKSQGVKSIRYVDIYKGDAIITQVKSVWCLMDRNTNKPTRIKEDILSVLEG